MNEYSKSHQLGKVVNPKKKKINGQSVGRVEEWNKARLALKALYRSLKIESCEYINADGSRCNSTYYLTFAHRNKRRNLEPGELDSVNDTLLLCIGHHELVENDRDETEAQFSRLRPLK